MPAPSQNGDHYAAEAYELVPEAPTDSVKAGNGHSNGESRYSNDLERDYPLADDGEDDRAILLQEMNGGPEPRVFTTKVEYDPSDDSAAAMVHRAVPETDDPTQITLSFRVFLLGTIMGVLGASISQLFYFKSNAPSFSAYFVILITHPAGKWLAKVLPDRRVGVGRWSFSLNPGAWNPKEHMLVGVFSLCGGSAYASDILSIQRLYYKQDIGAVAGITLLLTTQLIGFGLAGFLQDILVRPVAMVFPQNLVFVTMFHALHDNKNTAQRTQMKMFMVVFVAIFVYQMFPTVLFPTLNSLAVLCIVDNRSSILRTFGSGFHGFGFLNFSFDWNSVGSFGPFFTPWWAQLNMYGGLVGMVWIVGPLFYYSNFWDALKFPTPISGGLFNSSYQKFDVQSILNPDFTINDAAWEKQQPLLLAPFFALSYALGFAALTSAIMHVILWHRKDIMNAVFASRRERSEESIHNRLMEAYAPVPKSWYIGIFSLTLVMTFVLIESAPLQLPAWGIVLAVFVAMIFLVPVGIISAVSETTIGLNIVTEFIAGFLIPGKPIANVVFKCYGYMTMSQALALTGDLKMGLYMKIPPREMFITQVLGTVLSCVVNYFTLNSVLDAKFQYLDGTIEDPTGQWTGRLPGIFYSASVIWGLVGPARFFAGKYSVLYLGFLVGALLPILPWWLHKKYPGRSFDKVCRLRQRLPLPEIDLGADTLQVSIPIIFHAAGLPPVSLSPSGLL
ncbi:OPT superfamily oligopeptide transporter [Clavulina sp. PMI_390]|nr:OPT superfamily oligopeptide transporter [Clavulina sp. PMI_390]